ncbi:isopeptide-forming domain-containing fimbrial protein [Periweissella cryptocerci]|uniref:Isopeptide-forming domain-containing fimbrial protein n=1 Tax=Periweissella cryptocerci TaxID=2506420 RepID=A0A4P6YT80_9LACO|nr:SpaH/EbpB family LPXTG-anchored major pilin [Periweissella cryptocerci]QBO35880.1 isopeptide-forming domain-containing fimbrial protein [Periweissella cryptocerci]
MKFSKKQLKAMVMTAAIALPIAASGITGVQSVSAAPAVASDVTIRINKFGIQKSQPMGTPELDLNNLTHAEAVAKLEAAKYKALQDVEFKLYRLDSDVLASVKDDKFMGYVSESEAEALAATATEIELDGPTNVNGQTGTTAKVPNSGAYMIVETNAPAGVVQKSDAQVVQLPVYRVNSQDQHEVVNGTLDVYLKNRTNTGSLNVDKDIEDNTAAKNLKATFSLTKVKNQNGVTVNEDFGSKTTTGLIDGVDLTWDNLTYGTYKLVETANAGAGYQKIADREFTISDSNLTQSYTGTDKIKNPTTVEQWKTVDRATENKGTGNLDAAGLVAEGLKVGQAFDWHINTTIPSNIDEMQEFVITDTMPANISFNDAEVYVVDERITDSTKAPATDALIAGTDYKLDTATNGKVVFNFTQAGLDKMAANTDGYVYIKYNTTLNSLDADQVNSIVFENGSTVNWTVKNNVDTGHDGDSSLTWTGAKKFQKTDGSKPLAGAEFKVKNDADKYLSYNEDREVVWVDDAADAKKFDSNGTNAMFVVDGLAEGTYTLVETKTPTNYATMSDLEFTIAETDAQASGDATKLPINEVENLPANKLPLTGGMGYIAAALGGLAAMFVAVRGYRRIK